MDRQTLKIEIERLEFFKYVDSKNLTKVQDGLLDNIINKKAFFFPSGDKYKNINGRLFSFDFESLTEGGAIDILKEMRPSLEKAGLNIFDLDQVFNSETKSRKPIYTITINDMNCSLSNIPSIPFLLDGLVAKKFAKFLNTTLRKNKITERIYFINDSASDTELAFLTSKQVNFINSLNLNPNDKPYKFTFWTIFKPSMQIVVLIIRALFKKKANSA